VTRKTLSKALRRAHETTLSNTDVEVYNATASYATGDGYDITYPDDPTEVVSGRVESPTTDSDRDRGGTTSEADVVIRVPDEPGYGEDDFGADGFGTIAYTEYGDEGEAPARLRDVSTNTWYELVDWYSEHNGLLVLEAAEI